jgi:hypothetical protein
MVDSSNFQLSLLTSVLFFIAKVIEQKYIVKPEKIDYKSSFRNSVLVGLATFCSSILFEQFVSLQNPNVSVPSVFTGEPGF